MDYKFGMALGMTIGLGLAGLGSAIGLGMAVASALNGMSRQPEMTNKLLINMIIGCALIESITIYVLVFSFILLGKI
jgi:F-type H+-transporting ATPase subunit c